MKKIKAYSIVMLALAYATPAISQETDANHIVKEILHLDSLFWQSYNQCDVDKMMTFFTDDLEFYHDKGGLTKGLEAFAESTKTGLCGRTNWHLRREAIAGSVKVFPLGDYGAIISGEHRFYVNEKDRPEYLDGQALFTHVWLLKENQWKMARVLSYNHGPAKYISDKKEIKLSPKVLSTYAGVYDGTNIKNIKVTVVDGQLNINAGKVFTPLAESANKFFLMDRDLQFEFVKGDKVSKLIVWEKGNKVEEAIKQ